MKSLETDFSEEQVLSKNQMKSIKGGQQENTLWIYCDDWPLLPCGYSTGEYTSSSEMTYAYNDCCLGSGGAFMNVT